MRRDEIYSYDYDHDYGDDYDYDSTLDTARKTLVGFPPVFPAAKQMTVTATSAASASPTGGGGKEELTNLLYVSFTGIHMLWLSLLLLVLLTRYRHGSGPCHGNRTDDSNSNIALIIAIG